MYLKNYKLINVSIKNKIIFYRKNKGYKKLKYKQKYSKFNFLKFSKSKFFFSELQEMILNDFDKAMVILKGKNDKRMKTAY